MSKHVHPQVIEPGCMYSLAEAKARMGWGVHAFRAARRKGLKVLHQGRRGFVMGDELIRHVTENGAATNDTD